MYRYISIGAFGSYWFRMNTNETTPSSSGNQNTTNKQTLRVAEIAKIAGVHPVSVRRAIVRGDLTPIGSFRHKLVSAEQVNLWISGRKPGEVSK